MMRTILVSKFVFICFLQSSLAEPTNGTDSLEQLFKEYFQWKIETYPEWASQEGYQGISHRVENYSIEAIKDKAIRCQEFLDRSDSLKAKTEEFEIYKSIFRAEVEPCVSGMKHKGYLLPPVNFLEGIQVEYPLLVSDPKRTPLRSLSDYEHLLTRITSLPTMIDQIILLLRKGAKEGVTYAKESLNGVDEQLERLQVDVDKSDFYARFRDMPGSLGRHVVTRLQTSAFSVVEEKVLPAFRRLQEFLKNEYRQKLRSKEGILSIPNGHEFYSATLKWHISTDDSPEEVHKIGLAEVAAIQEGVREVIAQLGKNVSFREFSSMIREDQSQVFSSESDAINTYKSVLEAVNPRLSNLFPADTLTDEVYSLGVSPSPLAPGGAIAYYESGARDGSRPGRFYVKLDPLSAQKKYEAATLTLHEGNPGHNFQFAFNKNQKTIPQFITNPMFARYSEAPSRFNMPTAHVEGWGLYSEYLGFELKMYEDPFPRFGHYSFNLLRACRLVVDTGIHAMGWSREKAIKYMVDNTAMSRDSIEAEVDRYITWPGQACAYKIGERKIKELRKSTTVQLGDKFDIKEFHRAVLKCVGPLSALNTCIDRFVQSTLSSANDDMVTVNENDISGVGTIRNGWEIVFTLAVLFVRYENLL